jgi:hypothetical protein
VRGLILGALQTAAIIAAFVGFGFAARALFVPADPFCSHTADPVLCEAGR